MNPSRILLSGLLISAAVLPARAHSKRQAHTPQDQIEVVAHIAVPGSPIIRLIETQHYRRDYLYAEHAARKTVTLLDVTNVPRPVVLADMDFPTSATNQIVAAAGNAALVSETTATTNSVSPQTFSIMSFVDPTHPVVKQKFEGVTAMARDEARGLIFLANADGVWILQQHYATDPTSEKEWEHMMLDAR